VIIRRILVNNAGPFFSDWQVELPEGVTAVVAEYEGEAARSNRAGKSWLAVDGLTYALFGKFRGRSDDFVHRLAAGDEGGFVEYELESSAGRRFTIRRGRDRAGDPIRTLDGAKVKEADLEAVVEAEILGLSHDEFTLTNCFVQGRTHAFMELPPAEKRRVVSPWFRTDRWVPRAALARERLTAVRREFRDLEREREELTGRIEGGKLEVADSLPAAEDAAKDVRERLDEVLRRRAKLLAEVEAAAEAGRRRAELEREVAVARGEVEAEREAAEERAWTAAAEVKRTKAAIAEAEGRGKRIAALEREVTLRDELREAVAALSDEFREVRGNRARDVDRREELRAKFRELRDDRTGTCPVLRETCDRVERDEAVLGAIRTEGLRLARAVDRAKRRLDDLGWKLDMARSELAGADEAARELGDLRGEVTVKQAGADLERAKQEEERAAAEVSRVKTGRTEAAKRLRAARKALEELPEGDDGLTRRLAELAAERDEAETGRDEAARRVAELKALAADVHRREERIAAVDVRLEAARAEVENLAWAAYAFGATGIPSRELENAFGVAEDAMNAVLTDLGAPTRIRFSPSRELKEWEAACLGCGETFTKGERTHVCKTCGLARRKRRRDELRLEVVDGGNDSSFELDSGGGKVLLSLGVRLGLAQLPGAARAVRCESAMIDEPDGALDLPNRAALHRVLRDRLPALGIRQVILITHADVRDEFGSVVVVRRWPDEDRSGFWRE
jgi:DNA repair exonuclease SbcCD ATPase subunit